MSTEAEETMLADTDAIIEALEIIAKDDLDGLIQPVAVVEAARDPESPLHKHIWSESDADAAYERRLYLARHLIARVTVRVVDERREPIYVNAIVSSSDGGERRRGYVQTERAVADPDLYGQVIADAHRGITAYRNRLSAFERAKQTVEQLDRVLAEMKTT